MRKGASVAVVIPALNEAASIGQVLSDIPSWVDDVVVADNGSDDETASIARRQFSGAGRSPANLTRSARPSRSLVLSIVGPGVRACSSTPGGKTTKTLVATRPQLTTRKLVTPLSIGMPWMSQTISSPSSMPRLSASLTSSEIGVASPGASGPACHQRPATISSVSRNSSENVKRYSCCNDQRKFLSSSASLSMPTCPSYPTCEILL